MPIIEKRRPCLSGEEANHVTSSPPDTMERHRLFVSGDQQHLCLCSVIWKFPRIQLQTRRCVTHYSIRITKYIRSLTCKRKHLFGLMALELPVRDQAGSALWVSSKHTEWQCQKCMAEKSVQIVAVEPRTKRKGLWFTIPFESMPQGPNDFLQALLPEGATISHSAALGTKVFFLLFYLN